jgi:pyruvate dehydrogenase E2 component (dihydrolipoyllysine-residue acetyltransferase)
MPTEVIMPALGMAQETGKLLRWIKSEGDAVTKGEAVMEIETDKVTVEIEAPADGTLVGISAAEGEEVPVGRAVAFVLGEGEALPAPAVPAAPVRGEPAAAPSSNGPPGPVEAERARVLASPKARRLARERGVPIEDVRGTGPRGAIQAADVLAHEPRPVVVGERQPRPQPVVSSAWQRMAARVQQSWQEVPHFYLEREVDATRLNSWRETARRRQGYEQVTHTDLLIAICAAALVDHPRVNARWRDGSVETEEEVNVGIAVTTDDVLVVPVVHGADRLELRAVAQARSDLVARARDRTLRPEDVAGGTFTISNLGMFGVDAFHAIVNAPQAAILAVGRIRDRVVPVDGEPAVRPIVTVSLSFDHRGRRRGRARPRHARRADGGARRARSLALSAGRAGRARTRTSAARRARRCDS